MRFRLTLTGRSPLLMHNPRMVDPDFSITRDIKALTSKRKKTDADLAKIARLEWVGGLYTARNGGGDYLVQPTSKVRKCLVEAAKVSRQGKNVERAIAFDGVTVPLVYDGPQDLDELANDPAYANHASVVVSGKRVMRVRPEFKDWGLELEGTFIEDAGLNPDELERIVELAGKAIGIGDNRVNGYGRFDAKLEWLS